MDKLGLLYRETILLKLHLDIYQHKPLILLEERSELLKVQGRGKLVDVSVREAKVKF